MIISAVKGIGEVGAGADIAQLIIDALGSARNDAHFVDQTELDHAELDHAGPEVDHRHHRAVDHPKLDQVEVDHLRDGDVVVVTSKIVSKAEGRTIDASAVEAAKAEQSTRIVASRDQVRIVTNQLGIVAAAAGVDASNVEPGTALLLPVDPDASAARIRARLQELTGVAVAVIISDTAGRAWRLGQTDHAIGVSGLSPLRDYAGHTDPYGNRLSVTCTAIADELAAAADLVKGKLTGLPVAVVRGSGVVVGDCGTAREMLRAAESDLFALGRREAVLHATLAALGREADYPALVVQEPAVVAAQVAADSPASVAWFVERLLDPDQPPV